MDGKGRGREGDFPDDCFVFIPIRVGILYATKCIGVSLASPDWTVY